MSPTPTALLGLGHLPRPSISAKPGSVIPRGTSVTFVCRGPPEAETFRLEKDGMNPYPDVKSSPGAETEAIFLIDSVKTDTAGCYSCIYNTGNIYSERSEVLELVVTGFPGTFSPSPTAPYSSPVKWQRPQPGQTTLKVLALSHRAIKGKSLNSALAARSQISEFNVCLHYPLVDTTGSQILPPELLYILIGISAVFLLCLLLLVLFFLHHQRQRKHWISRSKGEEQNPQERFGPGVDVLKSTPDMATVNRLPENDRKMDTSAPTAGNPQEVTYAQLDHWALTQGAAPAVSPQFTDPMAKSSTYASLMKQ
ncbi:leukocyte-associated immunoglobulin-like receptor 1 [Dugong dugon]